RKKRLAAPASLVGLRKNSSVFLRINRTREVDPLFFDFDRRLVNAPGVRRSFYMRATTPVEFRSIVLNPAVNGTMIDMQTPLQHDLFEVPITQRIPQIPPHAQQNDVGLEVTPFEGILALVAHNGNLFCS